MGVRFPALKTVVIVFGLVLGNSCQVQAQFVVGSITLSQVANAAAQAITAGASLATTSLTAMMGSWSVACSVQVENWTRFPLMIPAVRMNGNGNMNVPPTTVAPGKREAFSSHKPWSTATGVSGTMSWQVGNTGRRFVVMWSVPYDHNLHSNWLGVGMTQRGVSHAYGNKWFKDMYKRRRIPGLQYTIREFLRDLDPIVYRDSLVEIEAQMGNTYKAEVKIIFRPANGNWNDLASSFKAILGNNGNNGNNGGRRGDGRNGGRRGGGRNGGRRVCGYDRYGRYVCRNQ